VILKFGHTWKLALVLIGFIPFFIFSPYAMSNNILAACINPAPERIKIVDAPARLIKDNLKDAWDEVGKVPVGTVVK